ncbi:MAG: cellobiohydrolase [Gammaproteobacteria bacterium]|nr:MAG: cellobiohydrolase [Gammaproteobacteria bacterium]
MKTSIRKSLGLVSLLALGVAASQAQAASCTYSVNNEWNTGFQGTVTITNNGTTAVNGWNVGWTYTNNKITSSWNATLTGSNPYSATALDWNKTIQPGQSVSFGVQGDKNGSAAEIPTITGAVCSTSPASSSTATTSSSSKSSTAVTSSSKSSVASSTPSSASSSSQQACGASQCNWYGTTYPSCTSTTSGWGYENGKSCIAPSTCATQPAPYGVVAGCPVSSASSKSSSVVSSISSSKSSVSSVISSVSSSKSSVVSSVSSVKSSSSSVVSSVSSSIKSSSSSSSTSTSAGPRLDNPFVGATWYVDPIWSAKAQAETGGSKVAKYNTAVWMDRIGAIAPTDGSFGLRDHLDAALAQGANLIQIVVYDLPNRDCHALASNGELTQNAAGTARYRTEYVDAVAAIFADAKYKSLRIVAIIEPDSLPNLVTNMSDPDCAIASQGPDGYVPNTQYTLNKLYPITNVYSYVDIGHSGWLGWEATNMTDAITLIGNAIKGTTAGVNSIAGFVSNTANTTPLSEPFLDPFEKTGLPGNNGTQVRSAKFYEWNEHFGEISFVKAWRTKAIAAGFPSTIGMIIDTGRNGWGGSARPTALSTSTDLETFVNKSRIDLRSHRGNWCNQYSGIGERPQVINADGIDAYVWVKPPGESDGAASLELSYDPQDPAKGFDRMCDPTYNRSETSGTTGSGAMPDAPVAGRWFKAGFLQLLKDAYPAL